MSSCFGGENNSLVNPNTLLLPTAEICNSSQKIRPKDKHKISLPCHFLQTQPITPCLLAVLEREKITEIKNGIA